MEYAAGDVQKGPLLLESQLKGVISNSKQHHTIMLWVSTHHYFLHYLYSKCVTCTKVGPNVTFSHFVRGRPNGIGPNGIKSKRECTTTQTSHCHSQRPDNQS